MTGETTESRMLAALRERSMSAQDLEHRLGVHVTVVHHHLRRLRAAGRVSRRLLVDHGPHAGRRPYVYEACVPTAVDAKERNQNLPFATITRAGAGAARAAGRFITLLLDEHRLALVLAGDLRLYALDPDSARTSAVYAHNLRWVIGTYSESCDAARVTLDIREAAKERAA